MRVVVAVVLSLFVRVSSAGPAFQTTPWEVGQFVEYALTTDNVKLFAKLRLFAVDAIGYWFQVTLQSDTSHGKTVVLCMQPPGTPCGSIIDGKLGWPPPEVLAELLPQWPANRNGPFVDVEVPAGDFHDALRSDVPNGRYLVKRWLHPAVPFGGVVPWEAGPSRGVLIGYGTERVAPLVVPALLPKPRPARRAVNTWLGLHYGSALVGRSEDVQSTTQFEVALGVRYSDSWDVLVSGTHTYAVGTERMETYESMDLATIAARFYPLGRVRPTAFTLSLGGLYLQADAVYGTLYRWYGNDDAVTAGRGAGLGAHLGFALRAREQWSLGMDVSDRVILMNSDEGWRHAAGFSIYARLDAF